MNAATHKLHGNKRKLTWLICVLLSVGFMAVSLVNYYVSKATIREALVTRELPLTSDNIYSEIQKNLIRPVFISSMMANDTFLRDWVLGGERDVGQISRYLNEIKVKYGAFTSFFVSEKSRAYYYPGGILKSIIENEKRDAWYFRVRQMHDPYETNVDPDMANRDTMTIFINHRVFDYSGKFIGAAGVGLAVDSVSHLVESYRQRYQRQVYFVDRQGQIVLHSPSEQLPNKDVHQIPGLDSIAATILSSGDGSYQYQREGRSHLLNVRYIPELKWYIFVEKIEDEALSEIRTSFIINMVICVVVTVFMLVLVNMSINYYQKRLEEMATTDALTGLANRQSLDMLLEHAVAETRRSGKPFSAIIADIDHFKNINDTYGHLTGDQVLRGVAEVLRARVRGVDIVCRWGGEEFLIVLRECGLDAACSVAENLRAAISDRFCEDPVVQGQLTMSLGVSEFRPEEHIDELLARADAAVYEAKKNGRDRVCCA